MALKRRRKNIVHLKIREKKVNSRTRETAKEGGADRYVREEALDLKQKNLAVQKNPVGRSR